MLKVVEILYDLFQTIPFFPYEIEPHMAGVIVLEFNVSIVVCSNVGEDVICSSRAGMHIKRLGEDGPYSLNKEAPFLLTSEDDHVRIIGRVLGIADSAADFPDASDAALLSDLRRDEIREFRACHGLD